MSPCLPEIYAQSYKDEQNLEMRCLCINSNTKDIEKRKENGYCVSTGIALSLEDLKGQKLKAKHIACYCFSTTPHSIEV